MKHSPIIQAAGWWIAGLALAAAGVFGTRVLAPRFTGHERAAFAVAGQLLALAGIIVIAFGVYRRVHRSAPTRE